MMQPYGTEIKGAGLFLNPNDVKWQNIMKIYRYISTVDIKWKLNHQNIQSATDEQIRLLITQKDEFKKVVQALQLILKGNDNYADILIDDEFGKKYAHAIIAFRKKPDGTRNLIIVEFQQTWSINWLSLLIHFGLSLAAAYFVNPQSAIIAFFSKVAADYGATTKGVSAAAAMKELERVGIIQVSENGKVFLNE